METFIANTKNLQRVMDDSRITFSSKGVFAFLYYSEKPATFNDISGACTDSRKNVQKYMQELLDLGYAKKQE